MGVNVNTDINRVLLIEDDTDDCEVFVWALNDISRTIALECCNDTAEAAGRIAAFRPDIIFFGLQPRSTLGLASLEKLLLYDQQKHIPIVIYSSYSDSLLLKEALRLGVSLFFEKPHSFTGLVDGLGDILVKKILKSENFQPLLLREGVYSPMHVLSV